MTKLFFKLPLLFLLLFTKANAQQTIVPFNFKEITYGTFKSQSVIKEDMSNSPTGDHGVVTNQVLIEKTEKIPGKLGVQFGTEYVLNGKDKDIVRIEIEWIFPKEMTDNAKKTKFSSIRYPIDLPVNAPNASTYSLDNDFEIIKGTWQLNLYYQGSIIYSKKFEMK